MCPYVFHFVNMCIFQCEFKIIFDIIHQKCSYLPWYVHYCPYSSLMVCNHIQLCAPLWLAAATTGSMTVQWVHRVKMALWDNRLT